MKVGANQGQMAKMEMAKNQAKIDQVQVMAQQKIKQQA